MKSAMELLGEDRKYGGLCKPAERGDCDLCKLYIQDIELVAKRAREEMREAAWREADCFADNSSTARHIKRAIQSLPVEAAK